MQFTTPTTKDAMYGVLNDLFAYYRLRENVAEEISLQVIELDRLVFTSKSSAQLNQEAVSRLSGKHQAQITARQNKLQAEIDGLTAERASVVASGVTRKSSATDYHNNAYNDFQYEAVKKGMYSTSVVLDKLAAIFAERTAALAAIDDDIAAKTTAIDGKIATLTAEKTNAASYFSAEHQAEISALAASLAEKQEDFRVETIKYNNQVEEKEIKHSNAVNQAQARYALDFLSVKAVGLTKDELIQIGYYQDAIDAVCGYYFTLTPAAAFSDIQNEAKLAIYLEDFYDEVVYLFQTRAS